MEQHNPDINAQQPNPETNVEQHKSGAGTPKTDGIVSVNNRSSANNMIGKVIFGIVVFAIVLIGSLIGFNKHRAAKKLAYAAEQQKTKNETKQPAATGPRRSFETDPPPLPSGLQQKTGVAECADGTPSTVMLGNDGKPVMTPDGTPMHICKDGRVVVPAVAGAPPLPGAQPIMGAQPNSGTQPISVAGYQSGSSSLKAPSRYNGDVILSSQGSNSSSLRGMVSPNSPPNPPNTEDVTSLAMATLGSIGQNLQVQAQALAAPGSATSPPPSNSANSQGSIGSLLTPSGTPMVTATKLGNRNFILPKGRTIDCGLSMRLVNEVAGMASCVVSQNIYSDNGRVLLLERGSEATGEYAAAMAQGQRRLFVLWSRIKTPQGVIIELNSPAADSMGTSGLDGIIDNHWWDRLGAAFMLSFVKDAIGYQVAKSSGAGNGAQSMSVFQSTTETGNRMAEKVLESTINIKPTLYRHQGSRGTIYVARDLDFGGVYALRAR